MATEYPIISADDPIEGPFKNVNIVIVKEEHHEAILTHIKEIFCRDEPMSKSVGRTEEYDNCLINFIKGGLVQNNGHCLVALDQKTNEVAGCRISKIVSKEIEALDKEEEKNEIIPEIFQHIFHLVLDFLFEPIKDPYEMFNVDKLVEYRALSVGDNYRQIGYEMLLRSLRLAKKNGIKIIRGVFSSKYSRRPAEELGFKVYNEIFYKDYKVNGEVLLKNMDPHPSIVVTIKEL